MPDPTPAPRYGAVAQLLHWATAVLVLAALGFGVTMTQLMSFGPLQLAVYSWHKWAGVAVFVLVVLRLAWRLMVPPPPPDPRHPAWQVLAAHAVHATLYAYLLALPLIGWIESSAASVPVVFLGLWQLPDLVGPDMALAFRLDKLHEALGYTVLALVALHVAAALKHHLIDRDGTLRRMLPRFVAGLVLAAVAAPAVAEAPRWTVDPASSSVSFTARQMNTPVRGQFPRFAAEIRFAPDDLAGSGAEVVIDVAGATTGNPAVDAELRREAWFHAEAHPQARFAVARLTRTEGPAAYLAEGSLTLRGVTRPVSLPLAIAIEGATARATGEVRVSRTAFGVGQGQWSGTGVVADEVVIAVDIRARRD